MKSPTSPGRRNEWDEWYPVGGTHAAHHRAAGAASHSAHAAAVEAGPPAATVRPATAPPPPPEVTFRVVVTAAARRGTGTDAVAEAGRVLLNAAAGGTGTCGARAGTGMRGAGAGAGTAADVGIDPGARPLTEKRGANIAPLTPGMERKGSGKDEGGGSPVSGRVAGGGRRDTPEGIRAPPPPGATTPAEAPSGPCALAEVAGVITIPEGLPACPGAVWGRPPPPPPLSKSSSLNRSSSSELGAMCQGVRVASV